MNGCGIAAKKQLNLSS